MARSMEPMSYRPLAGRHPRSERKTRLVAQKRLAAALLGGLLLSGCAGKQVKPTVVESLSSEIALPVRFSSVTIDAADGVWLDDDDRLMIRQKVKSKLDTLVLTGADRSKPAYAMKIVFTKYESGSAAARLAFIGLGQIHMEATITVVDATGKRCGEYKVGKGLVLGGIAGGLASTADVAEGFAKSVAAIFTPKS